MSGSCPIYLGTEPYFVKYIIAITAVTDEPLRVKHNLDEWFDPREHPELCDLKPGETKTVILEVESPTISVGETNLANVEFVDYDYQFKQIPIIKSE